jgi:uncharacterized protein (TIGR02421 family)
MGIRTDDVGASTDEPPSRGLAARVRFLSDRLVAIQRPIRILDAIKWDDDVERAFFAARCRKLPPVTRSYYNRRRLPFDLTVKSQELQTLERAVRRSIGASDGPGRILTRMCQEYRQVLRLLTDRGTRAFAQRSARLYGSTTNHPYEDDPGRRDLHRLLEDSLQVARPAAEGTIHRTALGSDQVVTELAGRLRAYFGAAAAVRVRPSDGIVADAAAGSDYIKIRRAARFTPPDVRLLEVHEGWVHLGTTLNGQRQPVCTFLSKGPPSATVTQEGLAVLTEILAGASYPARLARLVHRVEGVALAEAGADFLDVFHFFEGVGYDPRESYQQSVRVFRGSLPACCGPFTKDLCYTRGFLLLFHFLRAASARGLMRCVPLLFCGKTTLTDLPLLTQLVDEGLVAPPAHVPPPFQDLHALSAWADRAGSAGERRGAGPERYAAVG